MAVVPADFAGHDRLLLTILVDQPAVLAYLCLGAVTPEVDSQDLMVCEPNTAMVIVIGGTRMPHARQRAPRRSIQRVEKRPRITLAKMPPQTLGAIDLEDGLLVG